MEAMYHLVTEHGSDTYLTGKSSMYKQLQTNKGVMLDYENINKQNKTESNKKKGSI